MKPHERIFVALDTPEPEGARRLVRLLEGGVGGFKVGLRTEKSRLRRSLAHLRDLMRRCRHLPISEQVANLNQVLRGHYAYYGIAGNLRALQRVHHIVEHYWRKMLSSRSRAGKVRREDFHRIQQRYPLQCPKLRLPYHELKRYAVL